jgi:hypothetical protein
MLLQTTDQDVPPGSLGRGVLTAADYRYFPAVHATALSLHEQRVQYAVVDHGLLDEQVKVLSNLDVLVLKDEINVHKNMPLATRYPEIPLAAWRKPTLLCWSPFKLTAWIDADAIPIHYANELFQWERGFVTFDHFGDSAWAEDNYRALLDATGNSWLPQINAGVLVVPHDANWLRKWAATSWTLVMDKELAMLAHCRDQSALIVAMSSLPPNRDLPPILMPAHWNYPADGHRRKDVKQRMKDYPKDGPLLLDFARERHPGVTVVHWMGSVKPWMLA